MLGPLLRAQRHKQSPDLGVKKGGCFVDEETRALALRCRA